MTRKVFIAELNKHLRSAPAAERVAIIEFYNELLDERGVNAEEQMPADLGHPRQIAFGILRDLQIEQAKKSGNTNTVLLVILSILALPVALPATIILFFILICFIIVALAFIVSLIMLFGVLIYSAVMALISQPFSWQLLIFIVACVFLGLGSICLIISFIRWVGEKIAQALSKRSKNKQVAVSSSDEV